MMQVECISERINSKQIKIGENYWIDNNTMWSDGEDWYTKVFKDKEQTEWSK